MLAGGPELAQPTCQILPPAFPGYYPYCTATINPGPAGLWHGAALPQARALIAASGTSGALVTVSTVAHDPFKLAAGRYFTRLLDTLGYRARLRTYPDDHAYYRRAGLRTARSQLGFFGWAADSPAGSAFFEPLFSCAAYQPGRPFNMNPAGSCDQQIDRQIATATTLQSTNAAAANRADSTSTTRSCSTRHGSRWSAHSALTWCPHGSATISESPNSASHSTSCGYSIKWRPATAADSSGHATRTPERRVALATTCTGAATSRRYGCTQPLTGNDPTCRAVTTAQGTQIVPI
jgi:hypothetical protein